MEKIFDLEKRLVRFAARAITFSNSIPNNFAGNHLKGQLIRASCNPCLQYGEASGAESRKDFIHKTGVGIKELKEARNCLLILTEINYGHKFQREELLSECIELIKIFGKMINNSRSQL
ncbi:four helix bundle protein [Fontibacter flavus]|uniref:Four helix bundle protein n=1 Tax=Fontibacter flavus TaxID=654838 RepID=A0ABV6FV85_9BACT|nr:four helix bundle protein [Cyclobacteriaceae bacterium]